MPTTWLPDEVWAQLDPRQARLSKRARWALTALVGLVVVATTLIALGVASGELGGNLYVPSSDASIDIRSHDFVETIDVRNQSWFDETITGVASSDQHIVVTDVRPARLTIPPGRTRALHVRFHVTDCAAVGGGDNQPVIHLERFWGTLSVTVAVSSWTAGSNPLFNGPGWAACGKGG